MQSSQRHRIPILDVTSAVQYAMHDSTIAKYASSLNKDPASAAAFTETMGDLLAVVELANAVNAIGFVRPDAVVAEAVRRCDQSRAVMTSS